MFYFRLIIFTEHLMAFTKQQLIDLSAKITALQEAVHKQDFEKIRHLQEEFNELIQANQDPADSTIITYLQALQGKVHNHFKNPLMFPITQLNTLLNTFIANILTVINSKIKKTPETKSESHAKTHKSHHKSKPTTREDLRQTISSVLAQAHQSNEPEGKDKSETKTETDDLKNLANELHNALSLFALKYPNMPLAYHMDLNKREGYVNEEFDLYRKGIIFGRKLSDETHEALKNLDKLVVTIVSKLNDHAKDNKWLVRKKNEVWRTILSVKMKYDFFGTATSIITDVLKKFPKELQTHVLEAWNVWGTRNKLIHKTPIDSIEKFAAILIANIKDNDKRPINFIALYQAFALLKNIYINANYIKKHTPEKNRTAIHNAIDTALVFAQRKILDFIMSFTKGKPLDYTKLLADIGASHQLAPDSEIIRVGMLDAGLSNSDKSSDSAKNIIAEYSKIVEASVSQVNEKSREYVAALTNIETEGLDQVHVQDVAIPTQQALGVHRGSIMDSHQEAHIAAAANTKAAHTKLRDHIVDETEGLFKIIGNDDKPTLVRLNRLMQKAILCGNKLDAQMPTCIIMNDKAMFVKNKQDFKNYKPQNPGNYFTENKSAIKRIEYGVMYAFNALRKFQNKPGELQRIYQALEKVITIAKDNLKAKIPDIQFQQQNKLLALLTQVLSNEMPATQQVHTKPSFTKRT